MIFSENQCPLSEQCYRSGAGGQMRRRTFIAGLSGAAVAWPFTTRAQQPAIPLIGFLRGASAETSAPTVAAFRQGLSEAGYVEGRNVAIEYRWANGQVDKLPKLVADLVHRQVAVLVVSGSTVGALTAKAATSTIPIVFATASDPVKVGLVPSFSRPGGNVTGMTVFTSALGSKWLGLLREVVPQAAAFGFLVNPTNASAESDVRNLQNAAGALGLQVHVVNASSDRDFEAAFATLVERRVGGLVTEADAIFASLRTRLVALANRHAMPAIFDRREYVDAGGLMSYGPSNTETYREVGVYTARILNGARPADLPVQVPTKFDLVINVTTAKALGLEIPPTLIASADEVIE